MEYSWYDLVLLYMVYSFLGWVAETVVAAARGRGFVKRGFAAGPFCYVYGFAAVVMTIGLADLLILNEVEGAALSGEAEFAGYPDEM